MARHQRPPSPPRAELTPAGMGQGIRRLEQCIAEVEAFDPQKIQTRDDTSKAHALSALVDGALVQTFGQDTVEYHRYADATSFSWPLNAAQPTPIHEIQESLRRCRARSLDLLRQAVSFLKQELEFTDREAVAASQDDTPVEYPRAAFIVHGRDEGTRESVARFLQKIGIKPVILHELPNKGRTLITKFKEEAAGIGFAVVLMTPDDVGGKVGEDQRPRARQNVIFELGFFIGALGPERVAPIVVGDVELPSDYEGVVYLPYDADWRTRLGRELEAAGYEIDWNEVMR